MFHVLDLIKVDQEMVRHVADWNYLKEIKTKFLHAHLTLKNDTVQSL